MEKLSHAHPPPNCPACEEVGRLQAEDINRRKLEAADEMAASLSDAVENCETCRGERGPRKCARCLTFTKLLAAWEKVGKGKG